MTIVGIPPGAPIPWSDIELIFPMTRHDRIAATRLALRSCSRARIVEELAMLTERSRALARHALRYRTRMRAAVEQAKRLEHVRCEVELLRGADVELQRTAELLAEARAAAVPHEPVEAPDAKHWRQKYQKAKSEARVWMAEAAHERWRSKADAEWRRAHEGEK